MLAVDCLDDFDLVRQTQVLEDLRLRLRSACQQDSPRLGRFQAVQHFGDGGRVQCLAELAHTLNVVPVEQFTQFGQQKSVVHLSTS